MLRGTGHDDPGTQHAGAFFLGLKGEEARNEISAAEMHEREHHLPVQWCLFTSTKLGS